MAKEPLFFDSVHQLEVLVEMARRQNLQSIKVYGVELVFHPTAFIKLPEDLRPATVEKLKPRQDKSAEDEELLYHSA